MYDQFPDLYLNAVGIPEKVRKNISEVLVNALSEAFPDEKEFRILEPGIGLGQITKELWRPLETQRLRAQVYGIDISKEMLQELYLRLQKNGFSRITDTVWQKETLTIRGFKDDFLKWKNSPTSNFHAIFPIFFLHHLYDKWQEGLLKCFSALAPSGIIAVTEDAGDTVVWDGWFQNLDIEPLISNIEKFERRRKFIRLGRIFTEELTKGGHREFLPLRAGYMQPVLHVLDSPLFKKIDKKEFEWESTIKLVDKTEGWLNALEEKALSPLRCVAEKHRKKIMQNIKEEARALFGNLDVEIPIKRKLRLYLYEKLPFSDFESVAKHFVMHVNEAEFVRLGKHLPRPSSPDSLESDIDQKGTLLSIANYGIADKGVEMFHVIRWRDQIESWERNIPVYVYGEKGAAIKTFGKLIAYLSLTKHFIEEREFKGADLIFKDFPEKFVLDTVYVPGPDGFRWSVHYHPTGKLYKLSLFIPKTRDLLPDKAEEIIRKIKSVKEEDPSCIADHRQTGYIFFHKMLAQRTSISSYLRDQTLAGKLSIDEKQIESIKDALLGWIDFQEFFTGNKLWKSCRDKLENFARILVCGQVLGDRILYYPIATFLNGNDQQHSSGGYIFIGSKDMSVNEDALLNYGSLTFRSRSIGDWAEKAVLNYSALIGSAISHNLKKYLWLLEQKREDKNLWPYLMNYIKNQAEWLHYASIGKGITRSFQIHKQKVQNLPLDYSGKINTAFTTYFLEKIIETAAGIKALESYRANYKRASNNLPTLQGLTEHLHVSSDEMETFIKDMLSIRFNPDGIERLIILDKEELLKLKGFLDSVLGELLMNALRCAFSEESVVGDRVVINVKGEGDNVVLEVKNILGGCRDTSDRGYSSLFENTSDTARILDLACRGELEKIGGLVALAVTMQTVGGDIKLSRSDGFYITTVSFFDFMKKERKNDR